MPTPQSLLSLFVGLKWRAVMARSEAAKKASSKEGNANANFGVATGRSGESAIPYIYLDIAILYFFGGNYT
ncbi:hypothetical protein LHYA1_G005741 [Lachnellula hyalina]|uniref:Uncharacterized protein n=1 Tax=Lachnellula hyalina TaxID=1316788 RepID=A0A8H8R0F3_9HELO|nr:uncharacterized protein LHYA1_G005741 [Lachnellula hyalina]TVY25490.1 hypothetical protein LHYA1_G005741 [Lachnellula hyalina]